MCLISQISYWHVTRLSRHSVDARNGNGKCSSFSMQSRLSNFLVGKGLWCLKNKHSIHGCFYRYGISPLVPHPYAAALIWITSNRTLEEKFNIYAPPCIILLLSRELMMQTCFKHKKQTWNSHFEAFASLSFQGPSRNDSCDWTNRTLKSNKCWKDFGEETVFFPYENPNNLLACNERWKSIEAFQKSFDWKNYYKLKSVPMLEISQSYILSFYGQQNFQPWYKIMHRQADNNLIYDGWFMWFVSWLMEKVYWLEKRLT